MKFEIRKYHPEDAAPLLALFYDTIHDVNLPHYTLEQLNAWAPNRTPVSDGWHRTLQSAQTIVAVSNDSLIGFGNLANDGTTIGMLYVSRRYLGKGIGKEILKKLEKKLIKSGVRTLEVESSITARPFFEKRGYRFVQENIRVRNGVELNNFTMSKEPKEKKKKQQQQVIDANEPSIFNWKELLINKGFDLVMVILGVSIAFQVEKWKVNSDQLELEKFYVQSLLIDVNADIAEMTMIIDELEKDRKLVENYLPLMEELPADSLTTPLLAILTFETFNGHQNTYQNLLGTGLNNFSDPVVVERITDYYSTYTAIRRLETVYTTAIFDANRHFGQYVIYDQVRIVDPKVTTLPQSRNFLVLCLSQLNNGMEDYSDALVNAKNLKTALESVL